jgi:hypothetical protein
VLLERYERTTSITKISQHIGNASTIAAIRRKSDIRRRLTSTWATLATNDNKQSRKRAMKLPVAISVLLLASTALPALAATHPSAPVEMVQYRPTDRPHAVHPQTSRHRDDYNAHASAPSAPAATHAVPGYNMPPGWHCIERGGGDPSANPSWQFCE